MALDKFEIIHLDKIKILRPQPLVIYNTKTTTLQKVLLKANVADFLLDHRQNLQAAMKAYLEACCILQRMICSVEEEGYRLMLEAIWSSYMSRVAEIRRRGWGLEGGVGRARVVRRMQGGSPLVTKKGGNEGMKIRDIEESGALGRRKLDHMNGDLDEGDNTEA